MTQQGQPEYFQFGTRKLKTYQKYSSQSFRSKFNHSPDNQCLLDNLLSHRKNNQEFINTLHSLSYHLNYLHNTIIEAKNYQDSLKQISLEPQQIITDLENEIIRLRNFQKGKQIVEDEPKKENAVTKAMFHFIKRKKDEEEKEWKSFPLRIDEVKEPILSLVLIDRQMLFLHTQILLRTLATEGEKIPGLSFIVKTFRNNYPEARPSVKAFSFVSVIIHLDFWVDQEISGLSTTLQSLLDYGMISRICLSRRNGKFGIPLKDYGISHVMTRFLSSSSTANGFVNVKIISIPPNFHPSFLDEARHEILISPVQNSQILILSPPYYHLYLVSIDELCIADQMKAYRSMMVGNFKSKRFLYSNPYQLIYARRNLMVCCPSYIDRMIVPFQNILDEDPVMTSYFLEVKASGQLSVWSQGDNDLDRDYPTYGSDSDDERNNNNLWDDFDPEGYHNLMEGLG